MTNIVNYYIIVSKESENFINKNRKFNLKIKDFDLSNPNQKKYYNKYLFTEVAKKYSLLTTVLSFGRDKYWKKWLIKKLPELNSPNCLDLACGTGDIMLSLIKKYPKGKVVGLDLNKNMVAKAKKIIQNNRASFLIADICDTGLSANSFDIVTGGYALRNAPDLRKALTEIYRIMKIGATASFMDFSKFPNKISQTIELLLLKIWGYIWGFTLYGNGEVVGYISESLKKFPDRRELKKLISSIGFKNIKTRYFFFGFIGIISFQK